MVKIIAPGKLKHDYYCEECDCHFEFEAEDVTKRIVWDDHGGHYPVCDFLEINCPYCGHKITLQHDSFTEDEIKKMKEVND